MENTKLIYRPYRVLLYFLPFTLGSVIVFLYCLCISSASDIRHLILLSIASIYGTWGCLSDYVTNFHITHHGIAVFFWKKPIAYFPWEIMKFNYSTWDFKGRHYFILSPYGLAVRDIRKLINMPFPRTAAKKYNIILLLLDHFQDSSDVEAFIRQRIAIQEIPK